MYKKTVIILLIFLSVCLIGCDKERSVIENIQTVVTNKGISTIGACDVGMFSATLQGKYDFLLTDSIDYTLGFELSVDSLFPAESMSICIADKIESDSTFSFSIIRRVGYDIDMPTLEPETKYFVRSFITIYGISYTGNIKSFKTAPVELTTGIIDTISNSIICKANLFSNEYLIEGVLGVCYSNTPSPTIDDFTITNEDQDITLLEDGSYTVIIDNLLYGGCLFYRAYYSCYNGKTFYGETRFIPMPYKAVDMGLSVNWAILNIGANTVLDWGDYFAWGETEPYYKPGHAYDNPIYPEFLKEDKHAGYVLSDYFDCEYYNANKYSFYKYNNEYNTDTLELFNDAAHVLWGGEWRMPYEADWYELNNYCLVQDTIYNGVKGKMYTSRINGNELFVPNAGYRESYNLNSEFSYWNRDNRRRDYSRSYGRPIRPVIEKQEFVRTIGITLDSNTIELNTDEWNTVAATVKPDNATNSKVIWETDNERVATVDEYGNIHAIGVGMCYISATTQYGLFKSCCLVIVNGNNENNHEAVDLGLSVKWATCNVGAINQEDFGYYYYRGTVSPQLDHEETTYSDVAKIKWGEEWRTPTIEEWTELSNTNNCTWTWVTLNGINGYKIQSKKSGHTDNWIFLPAAGQQYDNSFWGVNTYGFYFSSSEKERYSNVICGLSLHFNPSRYYTDYYGGWGYCVRPVCP